MVCRQVTNMTSRQKATHKYIILGLHYGKYNKKGLLYAILHFPENKYNKITNIALCKAKV